jgi:hypothetical protein
MSQDRGAHGCDHWPQLDPCGHGRCCTSCRAVRCPDEIPDPIGNPTSLVEMMFNAHVDRLKRLRKRCSTNT